MRVARVHFRRVFLKNFEDCVRVHLRARAPLRAHTPGSEPTHGSRAEAGAPAGKPSISGKPSLIVDALDRCLSVTQQTHTTCFACARSRDGSEAGDADEVDAVAVTVRVGQVMPQVRPIHALCLAIAVNAHV